MNYRAKYISAVLILLIVWLSSGINQTQAQTQAQSVANKDKWGFNAVAGMGTTAFDRGVEAGFGWLRYEINWYSINPSPGVYNWTAADANINAALSKGMQVYADIMWAPDWAVQNTPGYQPMYCMDENNIPAFILRPGCENRRPNTEHFKTFVQEAVRHYGDRIRYWGFWNEPNYAIFWHSNFDPNDPDNPTNYNQNLKDFMDYIAIPGAEVARLTNPKVLIVGPEVDAPQALRYLLEREEVYRQATQHRVFDVISFHQYPQPDSSFAAALDKYYTDGGLSLPLYRAGRPVWVTESDATTETMHQQLTIIEQRTWIDRYFYFGFKDGKCKNPSQNPAVCTYVGPVSPKSMIDRIDERLPAFYAFKRYVAEGRIFDEQTPATFSSAAPGYEVATQFSSSQHGTIEALRFYRAPGETGNNTVRLWTDTGVPLASATFVDTGAGVSGWRQLSIPGVAITAGTRYRVSFNTNTVQGKTTCGLGAGLTNGFLTAYKGFWGQPIGTMPTNESCSAFFADVVFVRGAAIFTTQTPATFSSAAPGYEVATQFSSSRSGIVKGLRFYRAPGETGDNIVRLWTDTGVPLASARFVDNGRGASGWQQVGLGGVAITAGTRYRVSVNTNTAQSKTNCGLSTPITHGPLTAHQGFWGQPRGSMPTNASCSNFFVDVVLN